MVQWEIECRIGNGHDILEKIRQGLGVKSFLIRQQRYESRGYKASTRGHGLTQQAEKKIARLQKVYQTNWKALLALPVANLAGLQALESDDLIIRSSWHDRYRHHGSESELPWIWKLV